MPELTIASFNCHAGLQARRNGVCKPSPPRQHRRKILTIHAKLCRKLLMSNLGGSLP